MVTYFSQQYKNKYGKTPVVNRYKARWGFDAILMELDVEEIKFLIDYYLETFSANSHDLEWFFYNYDKLIVAKEKRDRDAESLARIREESKRRAEEWRNKRGNN